MQWRQSSLPIRISPDAGLIITNQNSIPAVAAVQLQAPQSVRQALASDDVVVTANLAGLPPGEHVVALEASVARQASVVDILPRQITVRLELLQSELKPVQVDIASQPPLLYSMGEPVLDMRQIEVSGPASKVQQVVEVVVSAALDSQRVTFEDDIRAVPVDVDGNPVTDVTLDPQTVHVYIAIAPRTDVREVRVQPNIVGQLPEGYVLTSDFDYNPKTIIVSGPTSALNNFPDSILTAPINLSDKTSSFEVTVPVEMPESSSIIVVTGRTITFSVGVDTQTITRQFDHTPVEFVGGKAGLAFRTVTNEVTVLVTGPQPLLSQLLEEDLSVIVDVSDLDAGESAQIAPVASILDSSAVITTSVLPAQIDVEAYSQTEVEITPESTAEPATN
jgi:YbbR domain-containing protein